MKEEENLFYKGVMCKTGLITLLNYFLKKHESLPKVRVFLVPFKFGKDVDCLTSKGKLLYSSRQLHITKASFIKLIAVASLLLD